MGQNVSSWRHHYNDYSGLELFNVTVNKMVQWHTGTYLTCSLIGTHLQANGSLVIRLVRLGLWVIKMSSGAVSSHASLTGTFIRPHLVISTKNMSEMASEMYSNQQWINGVGGKLHTLGYKNATPTDTRISKLCRCATPVSQWHSFQPSTSLRRNCVPACLHTSHRYQPWCPCLWSLPLNQKKIV